MTATAIAAPLAPPPALSAEQLAILKAASIRLRRVPQGWKAAPFCPSRPQTFAAAAVRQLIAQGYLEYGGQGWLKLTAAGRRAAP